MLGVLSQIVAILAVLATAVVYGTDVCAVLYCLALGSWLVWRDAPAPREVSAARAPVSTAAASDR